MLCDLVSLHGTAALIALALYVISLPHVFGLPSRRKVVDAQGQPFFCKRGYQSVRRDNMTRCIDRRLEVFRSDQLETKKPPTLQHIRQSVLRTSPRRTVVGLVWFGREYYVRILKCFLERNLRSAGGILDALWLIMFTKKPSEIAMGEEWARQFPGEIIAKRPIDTSPADLGRAPLRNDTDAWERIVQDHPDHVFIRIDDDVLFVKDGTFERLVHHVLSRGSESIAVANTVNHCQFPALHQALGAWEPPGNQQAHYYGASWANGEMAHSQLVTFIERYWKDRLAAYVFQEWDMNVCRCQHPQPLLGVCHQGYYRWCINCFAIDSTHLQVCTSDARMRFAGRCR